MHMHMQDHDKISVIYVSHQNKSFAKYRCCMYSRWQIVLILVVSFNAMTYINMVSVPTKKSQIYMIYITIYSPSDAHVFNTT
jgi:hypothetical protein